MGKILIVIGFLFIVAGILWHFKIFQIGKLPGDVVIQGENYTFYFPIVSSILISVILSLLFYFFSRR